MNSTFTNHLQSQLDAIRAAGTYKRERMLSTPQGAIVRANGGGETLRQHVVTARAGTVTLTEIQP